MAEKKEEANKTDSKHTQIRIPKCKIKELRKSTAVSIQGNKRSNFSPLSEQQVVELALADFFDAKVKINELKKKLEDQKKIITLTAATDKLVDANTMKSESRKILNLLMKIMESTDQADTIQLQEEVQKMLAEK
jgi:hypothetical protein